MTERLAWGRAFLMCPPDHFDVAYAINPWMDPAVPVDRERAREQWEHLVATLRAAGARVDTLEPQRDLPDMVFTANLGIVDGDTFVTARMRHPERVGEPVHAAAWFRAEGSRIVGLPEDEVQEGAGDALPMAGTLVAGYGARSTRGSVTALAQAVTAPVLPVGLHDPRWYHIDITLAPLDARRAIVFPDAWDRADRAAVMALVADPLVIDETEAARFVANTVVVGDTVVMPDCTPRVGRQLEAWGFDVAVVDVSEFRKAGGAVRCLTLSTDVSLSATAAVVAA